MRIHHICQRRRRTLQQPRDHHLAQLNISRLRYEVDDPRMADFTNNLALVNGLAERSTGFVWRYIDESGNSTATRPYADPRIAINLSVWESVEALERFVYRRQMQAVSAQARRRKRGPSLPRVSLLDKPETPSRAQISVSGVEDKVAYRARTDSGHDP